MWVWAAGANSWGCGTGNTFFHQPRELKTKKVVRDVSRWPMGGSRRKATGKGESVAEQPTKYGVGNNRQLQAAYGSCIGDYGTGITFFPGPVEKVL